MRFTHSPLKLELRNAFNLAHGSSLSRTNLEVQIEEGLGEAPVVPYYGMTPESLGAELDRAAALLGDDPYQIEDVMNRMSASDAAMNSSTRCGVDLALHDLVGKRLGVPLYRLFGLNSERIPESSFTIAIDSPETMAERARASKMPILKIKLGSPNDLAIIRAVRSATSARIRVDANGGWTREQAAALIPQLMEYDIELIEQPLPPQDLEGYAWLRSRISAPVFADESVQNERDLLALHGSIDGIVVKLMKSGGLRGAIRLIRIARTLDLKIMLSCMIESSLSVTAAAHIGALADYIDLDGPLLIANDPFKGIIYQGASIVLPSTPGIGVQHSREKDEA